MKVVCFFYCKLALLAHFRVHGKGDDAPLHHLLGRGCCGWWCLVPGLPLLLLLLGGGGGVSVQRHVDPLQEVTATWGQRSVELSRVQKRSVEVSRGQ